MMMEGHMAIVAHLIDERVARRRPGSMTGRGDVPDSAILVQSDAAGGKGHSRPDSPVWADPPRACAAAAGPRPRVCDHRGRAGDHPERDRVPDHPEQVSGEASIVARVHPGAEAELQEANG